MDSKNPDPGKLRLRNTDTNRFKVDTGRLKTPPPAQPAADSEAPKAGQTQKAADYVDPISLRDTSTSKLKKLDGIKSAPAAAAPEKKSETVRLKVVRATPRPGTLPPTAQAPLANVPLSAPESEPAPAPPEEKPAISIKPGATTSLAAVYPEQSYVGDKDSEASPGLPTETSTLQVSKPAPKESAPEAPAPLSMPKAEEAKPAESEKPLSSSTIKLAVKKPPMPAAAPEKAEEAKPEVPKPAALKIRPAAAEAAEPAAPVADQTVAVKPMPPSDSAGATVKVTPAPAAAPKIGLKLGVKKDDSAEATVAVPPAAAAAAGGEPGSAAAKGLRLSKSAAKTVAVPLPGTPPEPGAAEAGKPEDAAQPAPAPSQIPLPDSKPMPTGISTLEAVTALVAALALAVTVFSLVMSLLKQV